MFVLHPDALTTPDRVRAVQGWSETSHPDPQLVRQINAVSLRIRKATGREFGFRRYTSEAPLYLNGLGAPDLWLPRTPIRTLTWAAVGGLAIPVGTYSPAAIRSEPTGAFRLPDWDTEGRVFRPAGWPRYRGTHLDLTRDPHTTTSLVGVACAFAGDFGAILPQYSGEVNATHNPDGLATDIDDDLEQVVFDEIAETMAMTRKLGGLRREKTAGGRELEYNDSATFELQRRAILQERLTNWITPETMWAG